MNTQFQSGGIPWNKGTKGVMTAWNKGKRKIPFTTKICEACSKSYERNKDKGDEQWLAQRFCSKSCKSKGNSFRKGHIHSIETRKKMSLAQPKGENHPYWIKDRTKLKRYGDTAKDRRSYAYANWRNNVWVRDNFKCRIADESCVGRIEAHHILSYTKYPELRYNINNGITLCHAHHPRKRVDEERLIPVFKQLVGSN